MHLAGQHLVWATFLTMGLFSAPLLSEVEVPIRENKLLQMYRFFYLPFSLDFVEGKMNNDILPFLIDASGNADRLITPDELQLLDREWNEAKEKWRSKSLFLATPVPIGETVRISRHLISHRVPLNRSAFDGLPISERIQVGEAIKGRSMEVQADFKQLRFLRSFVRESEAEQFNFFIVSASWCESCKEYRMLMEAYQKQFPSSSVNIHSVVIEDPKEQIFDSNILKELFPHPKKYSHDSIPRFLAIEGGPGKTIVWEEGDALRELYDRYFRNYRGFMDSKTSLFKDRVRIISEQAPKLNVDPVTASTPR